MSCTLLMLLFYSWNEMRWIGMYRNRDEKNGTPAMVFCVFSQVGNRNLKSPISFLKIPIFNLCLVFLSVIVQHLCGIYWQTSASGYRLALMMLVGWPLTPDEIIWLNGSTPLFWEYLLFKPIYLSICNVLSLSILLCICRVNTGRFKEW